jgi:hypothetical protein
MDTVFVFRVGCIPAFCGGGLLHSFGTYDTRHVPPGDGVEDTFEGWPGLQITMPCVARKTTEDRGCPPISSIVEQTVNALAAKHQCFKPSFLLTYPLGYKFYAEILGKEHSFTTHNDRLDWEVEESSAFYNINSGNRCRYVPIMCVSADYYPTVNAILKGG